MAEYANLQARRLGVQVAFALMYTVIGLIVLLSAVWIGLNFANRLVVGLQGLAGLALQRVSLPLLSHLVAASPREAPRPGPPRTGTS